MTELDHRPVIVPHEVSVMRQWLAEDIIGNGFCPPLNRIAQEHRGADGSLNWETLQQEVDVVSLHDMRLDDPKFQLRVSAAYLGYIREAITKPDAPITRMLILPDLASNFDMEWTTLGAQRHAREHLENTDEGRDLADQAVAQYPILGKTGPVYSYYQGVAINIADTLFKPVSFFGEPIKYDDTQSVATPKERNGILSRAPYFAMQLIHRGRSDEVTDQMQLDTQFLFDRNTRRAKSIGVPVYEARMHQLRGGR